MKEKVVTSLLITTEDKILVEDNGQKQMKLPSMIKLTQAGIIETANVFANKLNKELKVGGILFVVEDQNLHKKLFSSQLVNETAFVFHTKNKEAFRVSRPYVWLSFEHLEQLDIHDDLKQLIISNQVIKSSVPLINLRTNKG